MNELTKKRDTQLDSYRGIVMILIVCVGHVVFWELKLMGAWFTLWECLMPMIFFISGVAMSYSAPRSYPLHIWKLIKRVVIPYYIFSIVCLIVGHIDPAFICVKTPISSESYSLSTILFPDWGGDLFNCTHLWFIPIYLCVMLLFPLLKKASEHINRYLLLSALMIILCICIHLPLPEMLGMHLREIIMYSAFTMLGYLFYRKTDIRIVCIVTLFMLAFVINKYLQIGQFPDLYYHKNCKSFIYMNVSLLMICIVSLLFWKIKIPNSRVVTFWNKYCYNIYLYHIISYGVVEVMFIRLIGIYPISTFGHSLMFGCLIFVVTIPIAYLSYKLEQIIIGFVTREIIMRFPVKATD